MLRKRYNTYFAREIFPWGHKPLGANIYYTKILPGASRLCVSIIFSKSKSNFWVLHQYIVETVWCVAYQSLLFRVLTLVEDKDSVSAWHVLCILTLISTCLMIPSVLWTHKWENISLITLSVLGGLYEIRFALLILLPFSSTFYLHCRAILWYQCSSYSNLFACWNVLFKMDKFHRWLYLYSKYVLTLSRLTRRAHFSWSFETVKVRLFLLRRHNSSRRPCWLVHHF